VSKRSSHRDGNKTKVTQSLAAINAKYILNINNPKKKENKKNPYYLSKFLLRNFPSKAL